MMFAPETLHGLTIDQLEAIRGYSDTAGAIAAMLPDAAALSADSSMFQVSRVKRTLLQIQASASAVGRYSDGVRFAVAAPNVTLQLEEIRQHIARAILARREAFGEEDPS